MASPSTEDALPLVFVDGVSNRQGPKYDAGVKARDALFRRFLLGSHRRSDGPRAVVAASGLNPVRFGGGDISPRDGLRHQ